MAAPPQRLDPVGIRRTAKRPENWDPAFKLHTSHASLPNDVPGATHADHILDTPSRRGKDIGFSHQCHATPGHTRLDSSVQCGAVLANVIASNKLMKRLGEKKQRTKCSLFPQPKTAGGLAQPRLSKNHTARRRRGLRGFRVLRGNITLVIIG